ARPRSAPITPSAPATTTLITDSLTDDPLPPVRQDSRPGSDTTGHPRTASGSSSPRRRLRRRRAHARRAEDSEEAFRKQVASPDGPLGLRQRSRPILKV